MDEAISIFNEKFNIVEKRFQLPDEKIDLLDKKIDNKFNALTKKLGGKLNIKGEIQILDDKQFLRPSILFFF